MHDLAGVGGCGAFLRLDRLIKAGLMEPAGLKAFKERDKKKAGLYSFEQRRDVVFDKALEKQFRAQKDAWKFFQAQPPGYRRIYTFYVMSAKQEATRTRRLAHLIGQSAAGKRIGMLKPKG